MRPTARRVTLAEMIGRRGGRWESAMAFQSVPETAEVVIEYSQHNEEYVNTMAARLPGGYTQADIQALADAVDTAVAASWRPLQTNECTYVETRVRGLESANDLEAFQNAGTGPGAVAVKSNPGNVTLSIKKGSGLTGRSARGRLFWIGLTQTQLSIIENIVGAVDVGNIVSGVNAVRVAIEVTAWQPVIVSRFAAGVPRPVGVTFNWTTTSAVNNDVDSQRGRLIG